MESFISLSSAVIFLRMQAFSTVSKQWYLISRIPLLISAVRLLPQSLINLKRVLPALFCYRFVMQRRDTDT
jgi:hypothetical protein